MKTLVTFIASLACFASIVVGGNDPIKFFATHLTEWGGGHQWILPTPIRQGGEKVAANYIRGIEILEVTVDGQRLEPEVPTHWEFDKMDEIIECDEGYFLHSAGPSFLSTLSQDADGTARMLVFEIVKIPDVIKIRYRKAGGTQEFLMESHVDRTVRDYYEPTEIQRADANKTDNG